MRQLGKSTQHVEVCKLGNTVRRQDEVGKVGYRVRDAGLDAGHAVARQKEGGYPRGQGKVPQDLNVVIGKVDCIMGL